MSIDFLASIFKYPIRKLLPFLVCRLSEMLRLYVLTLASYLLLKWWGVEIGRNCRFYGLPIVRCHPAGKIIIGKNCIFRSAQWSNSIGLNRSCFLSVSKNGHIEIGNDSGLSGTVIAASKCIKIGNRVLCGANVTITDTDRHPVDFKKRRENKKAEESPVLIEDDVWVGMNVTILKGVTIGTASVIASNSVVTRSIPAKSLAGGQPARILKKTQNDKI